MSNALPIFDAAQAGFIHLRETARESLIPAALTALAGAVVQFMILGSPAWALPLGLLSVFISVPFLAAHYRRALGLGPCALRLGADEAHLAGALWAIYFFLLIVGVIGLFLVIIASAIGMAAVGVDAGSVPQEPQAMLEAIGPRGMLVLLLCLAPLLAAMIWINARLICFGAASIDQKRIMAFSTWSWTKGAALRILAAIIALALPLALGVGVAGGAAGAALLGIGGEPAALIASRPVPVFLYALTTQFASLFLLAGPLAGQAAFLYRGFSPARREGAVS